MNLAVLIEFSNELFLSSDALGRSFELEVAGARALLMTPSLPEWNADTRDPLDQPLRPPAAKWRTGDRQTFWGRPVAYPTGESTVKRMLLTAPEATEELAERLYDEVPSWLDRFRSYVVLLTGQGTHRRKMRSPRDGLDIYDITEGSPRIIHDKRPRTVRVTFSDKDTSLHAHQFDRAVRLATTGEEPPLEHLLFFEARQALEVEDLRQAVMEAGAALEVCLHGAIVRACKMRALPAEELTASFRTLGRHLDLAGILSIALPEGDYRQDVVRVRNEVVHRGAAPSHTDVHRLVEMVERALHKLTPLRD